MSLCRDALALRRLQVERDWLRRCVAVLPEDAPAQPQTAPGRLPTTLQEHILAALAGGPKRGADLRRACPPVDEAEWLGVLRTLRESGQITSTGNGLAFRWHQQES